MLLQSMERRAIIERSLTRRGALVHVLIVAADVANHLAPEHLELAVADPEALLPCISTLEPYS